MSERGSAPAAENKMGTMPVGKLVFNMSLPMMVSMLVQALYNLRSKIIRKCTDCCIVSLPASDTSDRGSYRYRRRYECPPVKITGRT